MIPRHLSIRIVLILFLCIGLALPAFAPVQASPQDDPGINKVYITDVRDVAFVVSWTTDSASDGSVTWGTSIPPTTVTADSIAGTTTHWVTITGLLPSTTYYFKVSSGTATDDNGGAYYQVTTPPTIGLPTTNITLWGYVYQFDGTTPAGNAIVYLQLQDGDGSGSLSPSQWVSARANDTGGWSYGSFGSMRTSDLLNYYSFTNGADLLRIVGQGGSAGTKGADPTPWLITIPTATSQQNIILNSGPTAIDLVGLRAYSGQQSFIPVIVGLGLVALLTPMVIWYRKKG